MSIPTAKAETQCPDSATADGRHCKCELTACCWCGSTRSSTPDADESVRALRTWAEENRHLDTLAGHALRVLALLAERTAGVAVCRVCGCTDDRACPGGCHWVPDPTMRGDLCSTCLPMVNSGLWPDDQHPADARCADGTCPVATEAISALTEVGPWDEIDGDGTPAAVIADHIRQLAWPPPIDPGVRVLAPAEVIVHDLANASSRPGPHGGECTFCGAGDGHKDHCLWARSRALVADLWPDVDDGPVVNVGGGGPGAADAEAEAALVPAELLDERGHVHLCRDETCPACGWPETYYEIDPTEPRLVPLALGCQKCGWREQVTADVDDGPAAADSVAEAGPPLMGAGDDEVVPADEGDWLEDDDPEDCVCGFPGEACNCDEAIEWGERCSRCRGTGWFIPEHCCACHGSPYCTCCRACGASCVSKCTCPIAVALEGGGELVV